jgi:dipeptidyl aminopeptidase/acylaminoacyl peptidase
MRLCFRISAAFTAAALATLAFAADAPGKWTPAEMLKNRPVSDVHVSPDGKLVAFVVRDAVMESDRSEYRTQIWIAASDGKGSRQATFSAQASSRPRWSPDGRWIALLSKRGDKFANVWLLPTAGGEAWRLTDSKSDVAQAAWSPDGKSIAFIAPEPAPEDKERRDREKDDARIVGGDDRPGRLWLISVPPEADGERSARQLMSSAVSVGGVPEGGAGDALAWSPDGKTIAFSHTARPVANDWPTSDISLVDVATGRVRPFAHTGAAETQPLYSPDGAWIAYLTTDDPPRWAHRRWIRIAPADGGPARDLPHTFDEDPQPAGWSADGARLYFSEAKGVYDLLYALDVRTGALHAITGAGAVVSAASVNAPGTWIGFARQTPTDPAEAYASPISPFSPVRVSSVNADLPKYDLGQTRVLTWTGDKGQAIEGLLTLPVGYVAGRRYPLLLVIHGGPAGVYKATHIAAPGPYPVAAFAAEGYAVLRANPRGSSGYGPAFRQSNDKDWGGGDYRDLMAGVDEVIAMGIADPERLGVLGWSYGGYMTSWTITQTNRFKGASVGAGVTDLVSFTGTSDIPSFLPDYFGGEFWADGNFEVYRAHSAMGHVAGVKTPTIIQHGEADVRVPISQGYELYNALKRLGVPVEMVVYPRQPHGVREPRLILDLGVRNLAWMDRYVKGGVSAAPAAQ